MIKIRIGNTTSKSITEWDDYMSMHKVIRCDTCGEICKLSMKDMIDAEEIVYNHICRGLEDGEDRVQHKSLHS